MAFGRRALIRADVPVVIELPKGARGLGGEGVAERLGNMKVTLFTEPSDKRNSRRWTTKEIRLREFFDDDRYQTDPALEPYRVEHPQQPGRCRRDPRL
ncbi:hypothetical protein SAZ11_05675 [Streptomyces sp. FXJ1.4098]|nr:hypothetical protein [Streptomyces sp. FXJ1.4098]